MHLFSFKLRIHSPIYFYFKILSQTIFFKPKQPLVYIVQNRFPYYEDLLANSKSCNTFSLYIL